jgi:DNA-binding MarR family transcriptional regulator
MEVELKFEINLTEQDASVARRLLYQFVRDEDPAGKIAELGLHALACGIHDARQRRRKFFPGELFADPAWDIMLGLYCAHGRGEKISVTTLGQSVGLPHTTSLRWLKELANAGLVERVRDPGHRRRIFVTLTASAYENVSLWLDETRARLGAGE